MTLYPMLAAERRAFEHDRTVCPFCGEPRKGNAGDYYDEARCQADAWRDEIKATTDPQRLKALRGHLEQALYVGD